MLQNSQDSSQSLHQLSGPHQNDHLSPWCVKGTEISLPRPHTRSLTLQNSKPLAPISTVVFYTLGTKSHIPETIPLLFICTTIKQFKQAYASCRDVCTQKSSKPSPFLSTPSTSRRCQCNRLCPSNKIGRFSSAQEGPIWYFSSYH